MQHPVAYTTELVTTAWALACNAKSRHVERVYQTLQPRLCGQRVYISDLQPLHRQTALSGTAQSILAPAVTVVTCCIKVYRAIRAC